MSWWGEDNGFRLVTAVVESVSGGEARVRVDVFDNGADTFGPMFAPADTAQGDDVLLAFDQNDEPWIVARRPG